MFAPALVAVFSLLGLRDCHAHSLASGPGRSKSYRGLERRADPCQLSKAFPLRVTIPKFRIP